MVDCAVGLQVAHVQPHLTFCFLELSIQILYRALPVQLPVANPSDRFCNPPTTFPGGINMTVRLYKVESFGYATQELYEDGAGQCRAA